MKKLVWFVMLPILGIWILGGWEYYKIPHPKYLDIHNKSILPQRSSDRKRIPPRGRRLDRTRPNSTLNNNLWGWVFGSEYDDWFNSLKTLKGGGCIFIGVDFFRSLFIVKLTPEGEISFQKKIPSFVYETGGSYIGLNDFIQTHNGDFAFVFSKTFAGSESGIDMHFLSSSSNFDLANSQYIFGKKRSGEYDYEREKDLGYSTTESGTGDFFVLGRSNFYEIGGDFIVFKISKSEKRILWQKIFRISGGETPAEVFATSDGGCFVVGGTHSFNDPTGDAWVVKLSSEGECVWQRAFGGAGSDNVYSGILTPEEGLILAGATSSYGAGRSDFWLFEITPDGNIKPGRQIAIGGMGNDIAYSLNLAKNGDLILGGSTDSSGNGSEDFLIMRASPAFKVAWAKTYGGKEIDCAKSVQVASDENILVAGPTKSFGYTGWWYYLKKIDDILVLKISPSGETNVPDLSQNMDVTAIKTHVISYDTWASVMDDDFLLSDNTPASFLDANNIRPLPVNVNSLYPPIYVSLYDVEEDKTLFKSNTYFKLWWEKNPLNKNLDVVKYHIYVKRSGENVYTFFDEVQDEEALTDSNSYRYLGLLPESGQGIEYVVTALDASGRESAFSEVAKYWPGKK